MNINSYIYMNSRLEIKDVGVCQDLSKTTTEIRAEITERLRSNPYLSPLTADMVLYNNFNTKDQGTRTSALAYYSQSFAGTKNVSAVYRKAPEDKFYTYICDMHGNYSMLDYGITSNGYYHYLLAYRQGEGIYKIYEDSFMDEDGIQTPAYVVPKWDFWTICDITESEDDDGLYEKTGSIWKFRYNMENGDLTQNVNITLWDTLGRFAKLSYGRKNYISGSISCFLGDIVEYVDGVTVKETQGDQEKTFVRGKTKEGYTERVNQSSKYSREIEKYKAWQEFAVNGSLKLLKDYKGNAWIVQISNSPVANINMASNLLQTVVTFEWVEAADFDEVRVVSGDR